MSSSGGGHGDPGMVTAGDSPEYWVDQAEARISDERIELTDAAISVLRELIRDATETDRSVVAPRELEHSLNTVLATFTSEVKARGVSDVDELLFEEVWAAACIYPWCRR
jgi:hypothetical protein